MENELWENDLSSIQGSVVDYILKKWEFDTKNKSDEEKIMFMKAIFKAEYLDQYDELEVLGYAEAVCVQREKTYKENKKKDGLIESMEDYIKELENLNNTYWNGIKENNRNLRLCLIINIICWIIVIINSISLY